METKGIMPNMLQGNVFLRCAVGAQEILSSDMIQHVLTGVPLQELRSSRSQPARNQHERYYVILYYYCVCYTGFQETVLLHLPVHLGVRHPVGTSIDLMTLLQSHPPYTLNSFQFRL